MSNSNRYSALLIGEQNPNWLAASYARAFESCCVKTQFWDPDCALSAVTRGGKIGRIASRFLQIEAWSRKANTQLLAAVDDQKPDFILVVTTHGLRPGSLAQARVLSPNTIIYCIYPDSPHNLDSDRLLCLPLFDRVFTSSPAWVEPFRGLGARSPHYLPFAADPWLHSPQVMSNNDKTYNVAFVGNWRPEREKFLERFVDLGLKIWGENYWRTRTRRRSPLVACWAGKTAVGYEFATVCARTKIMLNVMDPITWPGPNMRTFEQPACGAFSLAQKTPEMLQFFTEGETIACFSSGEEAVQKTRYYLNQPAERMRISQAAYRHVINDGHTYNDRVRELLHYVEQDRDKNNR